MLKSGIGLITWQSGTQKLNSSTFLGLDYLWISVLYIFTLALGILHDERVEKLLQFDFLADSSSPFQDVLCTLFVAIVKHWFDIWNYLTCVHCSSLKISNKESTQKVWRETLSYVHHIMFVLFQWRYSMQDSRLRVIDKTPLRTRISKNWRRLLRSKLRFSRDARKKTI